MYHALARPAAHVVVAFETAKEHPVIHGSECSANRQWWFQKINPDWIFLGTSEPDTIRRIDTIQRTPP